MIILKADNRTISKDGKKTYISSNTLSAVTAYTVISNAGYAANDYILVGTWGDETSELFLISSVAGDTTINVSTAAKFAHPEGTPITKLPYNQVRFYHTTTTTFSAGTPLGTVDIDPQSYFTKYEDTAYGTGYGWFIFLNETTNKYSYYSNPIPYGDFDPNSAYKIIQAFLSSVNVQDGKMITIDEAFRWLSEGYSLTINHLNLVNSEYNVPAVYPISIVSGTSEYALPDDFSNMLSLTNADGEDIPYCKIENIKYQEETGSTTYPSYYLRGSYLGIVPQPTTSATYYLYYQTKGAYLSNYYTNITLPDNNYYCLIDFMMYRAAPRLGIASNVAIDYYNKFMASIETMKLVSFKQNANKDSWSIADEANV